MQNTLNILIFETSIKVTDNVNGNTFRFFIELVRCYEKEI